MRDNYVMRLNKYCFVLASTIVLALLSPGCSWVMPHKYARQLNKLSIGMTKVEVIDVMGDPIATKAFKDQETLVYHLRDHKGKSEYWVTFVDGKATMWGNPGDFGSAAVPTRRVIFKEE